MLATDRWTVRQTDRNASNLVNAITLHLRYMARVIMIYANLHLEDLKMCKQGTVSALSLRMCIDICNGT